MEKIGVQQLFSYSDETERIRPQKNTIIRGKLGHPVKTYFQLAMKVAELQFKNRDYVLLFRGQEQDYRTTKGNSTLKPSLFRLEGKRPPSSSILQNRFERLQLAEQKLIEKYVAAELPDITRLRRQRIVRWAIIQHYEICATPLLDVTNSLRVAASMATHENDTDEGYIFVLGVPNISGAITASSEAGLQVVRLSSACPPSAVRPHIQEGYLLGEYPEFTDFRQKGDYSYYEMDFGRRLVAKFRFNPKTFWSSKNYPPAPDEALYPAGHRDPLLQIASEIKREMRGRS